MQHPRPEEPSEAEWARLKKWADTAACRILRGCPAEQEDACQCALIGAWQAWQSGATEHGIVAAAYRSALDWLEIYAGADRPPGQKRKYGRLLPMNDPLPMSVILAEGRNENNPLARHAHAFGRIEPGYAGLLARANIADILEHIPCERWRCVVRRCVVEGDTLREVADDMGVHETMVFKMRNQGLNCLRRRYGGKGATL